MVTLSHTADGVIDEFPRVDEALASARTHWQEGADYDPWVIRGEHGTVLATLVPVGTDRKCLTVYPDGRTELHRCEYVLDGDGLYLSTEVTRIDQ